MRVRLKMVGGKHNGRIIEVSGSKFLIGRGEECQLRPNSEAVSRRHCVLFVSDRRVHIQDLKSANGTFVNDQPVRNAQQVRGGDHVRVGPLEFELLIEGAVALPDPSASTVVSKVDLVAQQKLPATEDPSLADTAVHLDIPQQQTPSPRGPLAGSLGGGRSGAEPDADVLKWLTEPAHPHRPRPAWTAESQPAEAPKPADPAASQPLIAWPILGDAPGFGTSPGTPASPAATPPPPPAKPEAPDSSSNAAAAFIDNFRRRPKGQ